METYFSDSEVGDDDFDYDGRPYRFEPEYTDEELAERRLRRQREEQLSKEQSAARLRVGGNWWCSCGHCSSMLTEEERLCCSEWDLRPVDARLNVSTNVCITTLDDLSAMINRAVVETFRVPKLNWKTQPLPAGPNGQLSME